MTSVEKLHLTTRCDFLTACCACLLLAIFAGLFILVVLDCNAPMVRFDVKIHRQFPLCVLLAVV